MAKEPFAGESTKQAVKPLRREGRDASAEPVCSCAHLHHFLHTGPRVRRAPGLPCALSVPGGQLRCKPRAEHVAGSRSHTPSSSPRRRGSSTPRPINSITVASGILDPRLRGDDGRVLDRYFGIIASGAERCSPFIPEPGPGRNGSRRCTSP